MSDYDKNIELIEKQCYEWLSIMNSDCRTTEEANQFELWLAADDAHRRVYDEVEALWLGLAELQEDIDPASYQDFAQPGVWERLQQSLSLRPVLSASLGLVICAFIVSTIYLPQHGGFIEDEFSTRTAEIREVTLHDESVVTLGALSAIEVDFNEAERKVELLSGEAFFAVEKDENRPFVVHVGDAEIRVLGTKFDVRRTDEGLQVSVLEGIVEVIQKGVRKQVNASAPALSRKTLKAEERIKTTDDGLLAEIEPVKLERLAPWRKGRLIYENASLAEVISDADRYFPGHIILDTEDLHDLPVTAAFRTDQIQEMMDTLSIVLPVSARTLSNGDIVIRRDDDRG